MRYVAFGKTGLTLSELGFGGIPLIRLNKDSAVNVLRRAHDQGITIYDTANMYLDSEEKIGMAFRRLRAKVIIASKSIRRDAAGMTEHVEKCPCDLPIPDMLKSFYDLYEQHRKCLLT